MVPKHPIVNETYMNFDDLDALTRKLRQGCDETRNFMIEGFTPIVFKTVRWFLDEHPFLAHEYDDLISIGFVTVVEVIDHLKVTDPPENENVLAYVSTSITNRLLDLVKRKKPTFVSIKSAMNVPYEDPEPIIDEAMDEVFKVCNSDRQRTIVRMRAAGYTLQEIGNELGINKVSVGQHLRAIEERYDYAQQT